MKIPTLLISCLATLFLITGCAFVSSHTVTPVVTFQGTNVIVKCQTTDARAWTFFDATSQLTRFHNSATVSTYGTNQYGPGTYVAGVNENSSSSNLVLLFQAAAQIAAKAP